VRPDLENRLSTSRHCIKLGIKIGEGTKIGKNVYLGLGATIGKCCRISDLAEICMGSILHDRVYIGKEAIVCKDSEVEADSQLMDRAIVAPRTLVKRNVIIFPGCVFTQNNKESAKL
jgi:UDP-3-O-[3-hydroxymyristoyl] glucosamine N-acyltransferase